MQQKFYLSYVNRNIIPDLVTDQTSAHDPLTDIFQLVAQLEEAEKLA